MTFEFEKERVYLQITSIILVVSTGFRDDKFYGKVMVVASMHSASRIVFYCDLLSKNCIYSCLIFKKDFCITSALECESIGPNAQTRPN